VSGDLVVMTWNVENLFRPDDGDAATAATYSAKIAYLAGIIRGTAADVTALQEIGSPGAAEDLRAALGESWQAVVSQHPDGRGIRVAVLSPHPLTEEAQIVELPQSGLPAVPDVDGGVLTQDGPRRGTGPRRHRRPRPASAHRPPEEQTTHLPGRSTLPKQRERTRPRRRVRATTPHRGGHRPARAPQRRPRRHRRGRATRHAHDPVRGPQRGARCCHHRAARRARGR
jgi:hypothetical protein